MANRRRTDPLSVAAFVISVIVAVVVVLNGFPALLDTSNDVDAVKRLAKANRDLTQRVIHESRERRDEACRGLELGHRQEVQALKRSYRFYEDPPPSFRDLLNNPLVMTQLREQERNAQDDQDPFGVFVPAYCDDPGFGLPEPDPKLPKHSRLRHLLHP